MLFLPALLIGDLGGIFIMVLLAYLSRQLGDALKIPPYYRIHYVTATLTGAAALFDLLRATGSIVVDIQALSMGIRAAAACMALTACLPYWKWLFSEYFIKQR